MKLTSDTSIRAMLAALIGNSIFGFSFLFTRIALWDTTPYILLSLRFLVAFLILSLVFFLRKERLSLRGKPWGWLLLLGILQPILYFFAESYGVLYTSSSFSGIMIALIPIVSFLFSALFLKEKANPPQVLFCLFSLAGVILISLQGEGGQNQLKGILFLLLAVLSSSAYHLLSRKLSAHFSPLVRTYTMFLLGAAVFLLLALWENWRHPGRFVQALSSPSILWALLYLGLVSSVIAFFLLNYANTYLPVTRTIVFANLTTILSVIAGAVLLHEQFTPLSLVAVGMILVGVWGVQRFAILSTAAPSLEEKT